MTHTRTHVHIAWANPYSACETCGQWVTGYHDAARCGCDDGDWLIPCDHPVAPISRCPSWSPVDGCTCLEVLGVKEHGEPEGT